MAWSSRRKISFLVAVAFLALATVFTFRIARPPVPTIRQQFPINPFKRPRFFADPQAFHALGNSKGVKERPCNLVYSAFFDHRDHAVKVVTDSDISCYRSISVVCQIWYAHLDYPYFSDLLFNSHMLEVEEGERLGVVYACNAKPDVIERPLAVSFFSQNDKCRCSPLLSMRIYQPQHSQQVFAACIPALFGSISTEDVTAFVEIHRLLGVEKFYFYKEKVSDEVDKLLQSYERQGLADILAWRSAYPESARYHNQQAMQQDCLLRNLEQSKWVAQFDIDEVIMPANGLNWSQMVTKFETNDTGVFIILNRFYTTDESVTCNNESSPVEDHGSSLLRYVYFRRLSYYNVAFQSHDRSKILFRPDRTDQARTHYALLRPGFREVVLNYSQAVLKHYRDPPRVNSKDVVLDKSFCAYTDHLTHRMRSASNDK